MGVDINDNLRVNDPPPRPGYCVWSPVTATKDRVLEEIGAAILRTQERYKRLDETREFVRGYVPRDQERPGLCPEE